MMKIISVMLVLIFFVCMVMAPVAISAEDEAGPPGTNYTSSLSPEETAALALVMTLGAGPGLGGPGSDNANSGHDSGGGFHP
jgi:hypothetical protein